MRSYPAARIPLSTVRLISPRILGISKLRRPVLWETVVSDVVGFNARGLLDEFGGAIGCVAANCLLMEVVHCEILLTHLLDLQLTLRSLVRPDPYAAQDRWPCAPSKAPAGGQLPRKFFHPSVLSSMDQEKNLRFFQRAPKAGRIRRGGPYFCPGSDPLRGLSAWAIKADPEALH